jgi:hypothetical protein
MITHVGEGNNQDSNCKIEQAQSCEGMGGEDYNEILTDARAYFTLNRFVTGATALARYRLGDVLNRDGYHLSYTLGRYTAACTWCEVLTGRIIDGNRYWPATISTEEATICQEAAHEAVFMQQSGRYMVF